MLQKIFDITNFSALFKQMRSKAATQTMYAHLFCPGKVETKVEKLNRLLEDLSFFRELSLELQMLNQFSDIFSTIAKLTICDISQWVVLDYWNI